MPFFNPHVYKIDASNRISYKYEYTFLKFLSWLLVVISLQVYPTIKI